MLGLLLLYFIGKYFYRLAEQYDKSMWGFAILGIVVYYAGTFVAGIAFALLGLFDVESTSRTDELAMGLAALPFGILSCYILYSVLEKNWKKAKEQNTVSIEDIGKS